MAVTTPTEEEKKALVRRIPEEINTGKRLDLVDEVFDEGFVEHNSPLGEMTGRDAVREGFRTFQTAFPDVSVTVEDVSCEGDLVAMRVRIRGTHESEFMGIAPSGNPIDLGGLLLHRVADGMVTERWAYFDTLDWARQLGATGDDLERTMRTGTESTE